MVPKKRENGWKTTPQLNMSNGNKFFFFFFSTFYQIFSRDKWPTLLSYWITHFSSKVPGMRINKIAFNFRSSYKPSTHVTQTRKQSKKIDLKCLLEHVHVKAEHLNFQFSHVTKFIAKVIHRMSFIIVLYFEKFCANISFVVNEGSI